MKDGVKAGYTLEFKQEAVRLVHGGEKISAAARTLGVSGQSLDNWVKAVDVDGISGKFAGTCRRLHNGGRAPETVTAPW